MRNAIFHLGLGGFVWAALTIGISAASQRPAESEPIEMQLRLKTGNYWVYRGTVEWTYVSHVELPARSGKKQITWKSEIVEEIDRGPLKAYVVVGSFDDLPWYEPGKKPGKYLWIVYENRFYTRALDADTLARVRDITDPLVSLIERDQPVLQFPLSLNRCTTELKPEEPKRDDLNYCWYIAEKIRRRAGIQDLPFSLTEVWTAEYKTMPDYQALSFAPGTGFVAFDFSHHGTLSEAHVKLVEAHLR
jgi:hypothetical protein